VRSASGEGGEGEAGARRERRSKVTDEPFGIAPEVMGLPLATVRRRAAALFVDLAVLALVGVPSLVLLTWAAVYVQSPRAAALVTQPFLGIPVDDTARASAELLEIVWRRQPGAVPESLAPHLAAGDTDEVERRLAAEPLMIFTSFSGSGQSYYDPARRELHLTRDALAGFLSSFIGLGAVAVAFFTVATWLFGGHSPGKWLLGIRIVRLDGAPLSLWDAFGRAGGYAASASTLFLGFVEAARDPNRQALHDRIAGTVVVRARRRAAWAKERH